MCNLGSYWVEPISKINNSIIINSIFFSIHKKESQQKFHCSHRHEVNHCSSLLCAKTYKYSITKTLCMWSDSLKIYSKSKPQTNSLIALSHSLLVRHQEICHPRHLHHQNQSQEKAHEAYPFGKSSQVYLSPDVSPWFWKCHIWSNLNEITRI